jgi:hypothetical protein
LQTRLFICNNAGFIVEIPMAKNSLAPNKAILQAWMPQHTALKQCQDLN